MYALEFRAASRNHIWIRCAICETKAPLERVRQGQPDMTRWACSAPSRNGAGCLC